MGYMAHIQETTIDNVVNSGPGLVFLTYPDLVLNLPGSVLWAVIFFIMLLVLLLPGDNLRTEHFFAWTITAIRLYTTTALYASKPSQAFL